MWDTFDRRGEPPQILEGVSEITISHPEVLDARALLVPAYYLSQLEDASSKVLYRPPPGMKNGSHFTGKATCALVCPQKFLTFSKVFN